MYINSVNVDVFGNLVGLLRDELSAELSRKQSKRGLLWNAIERVARSPGRHRRRCGEDWKDNFRYWSSFRQRMRGNFRV